MTCDCRDAARRSLVVQLAHRASVMSAHSLLEEAVHEGNAELVSTAASLLENALQDQINVEKGFHSPKPSCKASDCVDCFWNLVCTHEGVEKSLAESRKAVQEAKDLADESARAEKLRRLYASPGDAS